MSETEEWILFKEIIKKSIGIFGIVLHLLVCSFGIMIIFQKQDALFFLMSFILIIVGIFGIIISFDLLITRGIYATGILGKILFYLEADSR